MKLRQQQILDHLDEISNTANIVGLRYQDSIFFPRSEVDKQYTLKQLKWLKKLVAELPDNFEGVQK